VKSFAQNITIYSLSLYILTFILNGVHVSGGWLNYALAGSVLYIMFRLLKPLLSLISLPLNFITFGMFSFITNAIILYLLTVFLPIVSIKAFTYQGISLAGFIVPKFYINTFFAFILASLVLSAIISFLSWIIKK